MHKVVSVIQLRIAFLVPGTGGFPRSGAYANRLLAMANGLQTQGAEVEFVFVFNGANNLPSNEGVFDGVKYRYLVGNTNYRSRIGKLRLYSIGFFAGLWFLYTKRKEKYFRAIACYHSAHSSFLWAAGKALGIPIVRELNEYSIPIIIKGLEGQSALDIISDKFLLKWFDGFIFISTRLAEYYGRMFPGKQFIIVPINVDSKRMMSHELRNNATSPHITYSGALSVSKDGIDILIRSFANLLKSYPYLRLKLVGKEPTEQDRCLMRELINELGIRDKIDFLGYLDRDKSLEALIDSRILVLARPDTIQGRGGMPTKLGEYLATGIPIVSTNVGDIDRYFFDGVNLIVARPGYVQDFTTKLLWVLEHYDEAVSIAARGKELINTEFSIYRQAKDLIEFMGSLGRQTASQKNV